MFLGQKVIFCHYLHDYHPPPSPDRASNSLLLRHSNENTYMSQTQMKANVKQPKSTSYNSGA